MYRHSTYLRSFNRSISISNACLLVCLVERCLARVSPHLLPQRESRSSHRMSHTQAPVQTPAAPTRPSSLQHTRTSQSVTHSLTHSLVVLFTRKGSRARTRKQVACEDEDLCPLVGVDLAPDDDLAIIRARREQRAESRMSPRYLPHGSLVAV